MKGLLLLCGLELVARPGEPMMTAPRVLQLARVHNVRGRIEKHDSHPRWCLGSGQRGLRKGRPRLTRVPSWTAGLQLPIAPPTAKKSRRLTWPVEHDLHIAFSPEFNPRMPRKREDHCTTLSAGRVLPTPDTPPCSSTPVTLRRFRLGVPDTLLWCDRRPGAVYPIAASSLAPARNPRCVPSRSG